MRRLIRFAAIALGLAGLGLAGLLGAAHLQIRRIAPALPTDPELLALLDAADRPVSVESLVVADQASPRGLLGHAVFVARWADGRAFLIDAGMDRDGAAEFAELMKTLWGADDGRFHGDVAEQLGAEIRDVRGVGFTHLHVDHVQGIGAFCAARGAGAVVHRTRWQAEQHNFNTREGAALVEDSCLETRTLDGAGLLAVGGSPSPKSLFSRAGTASRGRQSAPC